MRSTLAARLRAPFLVAMLFLPLGIGEVQLKASTPGNAGATVATTTTVPAKQTSGTAVKTTAGGSDPPAIIAKSTGVPPPGSGAKFFTQEFTSATSLAPPTTGAWLTNIRILTGVGPGAMKLLYLPPNIAVFPWGSISNTAATGVSFQAQIVDYPVSWYLSGTSMPSSVVTFMGNAPANVQLTYSNQKGVGPDISVYRGSTGATLTSSAASTVTNTITFEAGPSHARSILFLIGWGSGTFTGTPICSVQMPPDGVWQQSIQGCSIAPEAYGGGYPGVPVEEQGDANTLVLNMITGALGGLTTLETIVVAYY